MKIPAVLCIRVQGKDGVIDASTKINLPCLPFEGLCIDGLRVIKIDWRSESQSWRLTLDGYAQPHGEVRHNFARQVGDPSVWNVELQEKAAYVPEAAAHLAQGQSSLQAPLA
jgi:hypothetical protein